jgi:uncharacterized protein (DUF1330 family)
MLYITQLIYITEGQESVFDDFEAVAIPIISKYNGKMLLRVRPGATGIIESCMEVPYEIHLVQFERESDFNDFMRDEERKQFLHLKEQSIKAAVLIKGERM